jgi:hypothetical protein
MFSELAEIKFLLEGLAKETAITVDNNKIERMLAIAGAFDHLLEARPPIIVKLSPRIDGVRSNGSCRSTAPTAKGSGAIVHGYHQ